MPSDRGRAGRRHAGLCRPLRSRRIRRGAGAGRAAAHRAARLLCRHGGAGRRAGGACAAGKRDRLRLAGRDLRRSAAWSAAAASPGRRHRRGRAAGLAGVRRHDPHRVDGRRRAGPASAVDRARGGRLRRRRSAAWWRASRAISWCASTPGRSTASPRWRASYLARLPAREGRAPRHRRQRRSAGPPHGQGASRAPGADAGARRSPSWLDPATEGRAREAPAHHPARSVRHLRVRARGRAGRMGGVRRLRVLGRDPATLEGKARAAFRGGFLGVASLGWSTLVQIVEASDADRAGLVDMLAQQLVARLRRARRWPMRAPRRKRRSTFAASLCSQPPDTLIAVHRTFDRRRNPRSLPHAAPARRTEAAARVLLPRGRGRGRRAGRNGRSGRLGCSGSAK